MHGKRDQLLDDLIRGVNAHVRMKGERAYIHDPVFHIIRNRVHAEFSKTLMRETQYSYAFQFVNTLLVSQNDNGSWNEIHPHYNEPSALITSIVGEALLMALAHEPGNQRLHDSVHRAKEYVRSCELESGYFLKSTKYTADHLNVDATCGAYLAQYGKFFSDTDALSAAKRAAERIIRSQIEGWYPYTTNKGNYSHVFHIPCIHYQGVTMFYLLKINEVIHNPNIRDSLLRAAKWLASTQRKDGSFDWSKSGLMFAYHLSGAYVFGYAAFSQISKINPEFQKNADALLTHVNVTSMGLLPRWDLDPGFSIFHSLGNVWNVSKIGNFPFREKCFRFGYGMYRDFARQRYSEQINKRSFNLISSVLGINPSTVDPFTNYPDMFMTTEALDCLSSK